MLKGALHVHSTYSDGERSLGELRDLFLREGCRFVCLSDHADAFDGERIQQYVAECRSLSDDEMILIPGLEFGCDRRLHILAFGFTQLLSSTEPVDILEAIEREGAFAVIAHPPDALFEWVEGFRTLPHGIEVWNAKYDGRFAPRPTSFALLQRLQGRRPDLLAYYGLDLHWRKQFHKLYTFLHVDCLTTEGVLSALCAGAFHGSKDEHELPSSGRLSEAQLREFDRRHGQWERVRAVINTLNRWRKGLRAEIPAPLKAELRRLF